jgi:hypothetical protein
MGRHRRPFGNLSVIILKKKMELRSILILQGFKYSCYTQTLQWNENFELVKTQAEQVQTIYNTAIKDFDEN